VECWERLRVDADRWEYALFVRDGGSTEPWKFLKGSAPAKGGTCFSEVVGGEKGEVYIFKKMSRGEVLRKNRIFRKMFVFVGRF